MVNKRKRTREQIEKDLKKLMDKFRGTSKELNLDFLKKYRALEKEYTKAYNKVVNNKKR